MQSNAVVNAIHKNCLGAGNMQSYVSTLILFVLKKPQTNQKTQTLYKF